MWSNMRRKFPLALAVIVAVLFASTQVTNGAITFTCNPMYTITATENADISNVLTTCTTDGDEVKIKTENPGGSFEIKQCDSSWCLYFQLTPDYEMDESESVTLIATTDSETSAPLSFTVVILDADDNPPRISADPTTISWEENKLTDELIALTVTDADGSSVFDVSIATLSFTNEDGDYQGTFGLSDLRTSEGKGTAYITLLKQMNYETTVSYSLTIAATGSQDSIYTETTVVINVEDVEDSPPYFTNIAPYSHISEDAPVGQSVLSVVAIDGDKGINHAVSYSITAGNDGDVFAIDPTSGKLTVAKPLDRESITSLYLLTITATEQGSSLSAGDDQTTATTTCTIQLDDVNDNPPNFSSTTYEGTVAENSHTGTLVIFSTQITVSDGDEADNANFNVQLNDPSGVFEIDPTSGNSIQTFSIKVSDSSKLDYETMPTAEITIIATDPTISTLTETATVTISIENVNDIPPTITSVDCDDIPEDTPMDTSICTVVASCSDTEFAGIKYSGNFGQLQGKIDIDSDTGIIKVVADNAFNYELVQSYVFSVTATNDNGNGLLDTENNVQLNIVDVNDNSPRFQPASYETVLNDDATDFTVPLVLQATDADSSVNSELTFSISDGSDQFKLGTATVDEFNVYSLLISPKSPIDFETLSGCTSSDGCPINVIVLATDGGTPSQTGTATVTVILMDINDHSPEFDSPSYEKTVLETDSPGSTVLTVSANDADASDAFNQVHYRLENDGAANFAIDQTTGVITISENAQLDPDIYNPVKTEYKLKVYANDGAGRETGVDVTITVQDVDNKPPSFTNNGIYSTNFSEGSDFSSEAFFTVLAVDVDEDAVLSYSIDFENSIAYNENGQTEDIVFDDYFNIDALTGELFLKKVIDREVDFDSVSLSLVVTDDNTDSAFPDKKSDTGSLFVQIDDLNDCTPQFTQSSYNGQVNEGDYSTSATVINVDNDIVADDDDRDFGLVSYVITPADSRFKIDSHTGLLTVIGSLDYETDQLVVLTVVASDNGKPELSASTTVTVSIANLNDNMPEFGESKYDFQYTEDTDPIVLGSVKATDGDLGDFGVISYFFKWTEGTYDDKFIIDADSGDISMLKKIDYDKDPILYNMEVLAYDNYNTGHGTSNTASASVVITIEPTNDFSPTFESIDYNDIDELSKVDTLVCTITATDGDLSQGPDGQFSFTINDENEYFAIEDPTVSPVVIRVAKDLTNKPGNVTFDIIATDKGTPPRSNSETVTINIVDINNNPPVLDSIVIKAVKVSNCSHINDFVTTITYTDVDIDEVNRDSTFQMDCICTNGTKEGHTIEDFVIDENTGVITVNEELHKVDCRTYQLTVTVSNTVITDQVLEDIGTYVIQLKKCNDTPPEFPDGEQEISCSIDEDAVTNQTICKFYVPEDTDFDEDPIVPIYCFAVGGDLDYFDIDPNFPYMAYYKGPSYELDYDKGQRNYTLVIFASEVLDQTFEDPIDYNPNNKSLGLLTILLQDVNDNAPYFASENVYTGVNSDYKIGDRITTLTAVDPDEIDQTKLTYYGGPITITDNKNMATVPDNCVKVDPSGDIILEYAFSDDMTGYISFEATVYDGGKAHNSKTSVKIYVVSSSEQLVCYAMQSEANFNADIQDFQNAFSTVTGYNVVVDEILPHQGDDGNPITDQCEVRIHMANSQNDILSADQAIIVVQDNYDELFSTVFNEYQVYQIEKLIMDDNGSDNLITYILISVLALLALICIVLIILSIYQNRRMKRKLNAATAPAFGSQNSGLNRVEVPTTNQHAIQGSNPIWNAASDIDELKLGNNFEEISDNMSTTSSLADIKHDDNFEGGLNNPTFEERIENMFNIPAEDADSNSQNSIAFSFGDNEDDSRNEVPVNIDFNDENSTNMEW
ncbi:Cadherin-23 [Chamberlinius hualienensis]